MPDIIRTTKYDLPLLFICVKLTVTSYMVMEEFIIGSESVEAMHIYMVDRPWPIMLKFWPIMLLSNAHKSHPLCSILCP